MKDDLLQTGVDIKPGVTEGSEWLVANWDHAERPLLPTVRKAFGLSVLQGIAAIREAHRLRASSGAKDG
jgi:hypothetical protein